MNVRRLPAAALLLVLVLIGLLPAPLAHAQGTRADTGLGIRLLEAPTARADDPRARVYVVDRVRPGAAFTRKIEVVNDTPDPMDVLLYGATAKISDGDFDVLDADSPGAAQDWISVTPSRVRLAPRERREITAVFRVPADTAEGEYYAAVVAERPAAPDSGQVSVALRTAIRVYLSVGPGAEPASDFTVGSLTPGRDADGYPTLTALVTNTGGRALDLRGALDLSGGPGGLRAGPFDSTVPTTLAPGQSGPAEVTLDPALPAGPWHAVLTLTSGRLVRAVEADLSFPSARASSGEPVVPRPVDLRRDYPWLLGLAVGLLLLLGLALWWLLVWRRRRDDEDPPPDGVVPALRERAASS